VSDAQWYRFPGDVGRESHGIPGRTRSTPGCDIRRELRCPGGAGVGANFNLGKKNSVNQLSQLVGSTNNALLRIDNNAGNDATALDLRLEPGLAPMKVNSSTPGEQSQC
jgi:hypothetical protein